MQGVSCSADRNDQGMVCQVLHNVVAEREGVRRLPPKVIAVLVCLQLDRRVGNRFFFQRKLILKMAWSCLHLVEL